MVNHMMCAFCNSVPNQLCLCDVSFYVVVKNTGANQQILVNTQKKPCKMMVPCVHYSVGWYTTTLHTIVWQLNIINYIWL